jgi:hypothetical protein
MLYVCMYVESNEGRSMAAPLSKCTIEEQRAIVRFLWAEGIKSVEIHRRMLAQYGECTMHQQMSTSGGKDKCIR